MNFSFIEQIVEKYLAANPQVLEKLVSDLFTKLIAKLEADLNTPSAPTA